MTTYPADQFDGRVNEHAREILTVFGIPDCLNIGFRAADSLGPTGNDPAYIQIGAFGIPPAPVAIAPDGTVVNFSPWSDTSNSLVNTSLKAFVDTLDAIADFGPLPGDFDLAKQTGDRLRPILIAIDPVALAEHDGVWSNMLDEIAAGMYGDAPE